MLSLHHFIFFKVLVVFQNYPVLLLSSLITRITIIILTTRVHKLSFSYMPYANHCVL